MDEEDLRLNSLNRFSKRSKQLALEEHGHCEVPAGCGGVVLRWRNLNEGLSMTLWSAAPGQAEQMVDGEPVNTSRRTIPLGEHILAVHVPKIEGTIKAFLFAARLDRGGHWANRLLESVSSAADGSWRMTDKKPHRSWMELQYDDQSWTVMNEVQLPAKLPDRERWRFQYAQEMGAVPLGIPKKAKALWIRKRFTLTSSMSYE